MAHLPPKIPTTIPLPSNWPPANPHHSMSSFFPTFAAAATTTAPALPSLVDEFFDVASAKSGTLFRTVSDPISSLEAAAGSQPEASAAPPASSSSSLNRLCDEQHLSMFPHDWPPSSSAAPSTLSDRNSINDDKPLPPRPSSSSNPAPADDPSEVQSPCNAELAKTPPPPPPPPAAMDATPHPFIDPKRVKRILANRQSAQRSRVRKLQYISELERSVTMLQDVSSLSPRVAFLDHHRSSLTAGNSHLKQRIAALAQDKIFKEAHQEALKKEIERLRQVYHQQSLKKMAASAAGGAATS
ncbi:Transcription factor VIP1 [Apostasia shenzhenica]|uniref:Transcription factor VIP1 n=1 Tax=Apostasia shenzhenica TaxID=1088818 RepID=A0A2I0AJ58_9ASPA|nr:Transcription factor VIP1 [Apostasia shenzhenica]